MQVTLLGFQMYLASANRRWNLSDINTGIYGVDTFAQASFHLQEMQRNSHFIGAVFKALKLNETCIGSTAINGIDDHIIVNISI